MNRSFIPGLLFLICLSLHAQNPPDLDFHLQLSGESHAFHMGEPILLEAVFSSATEHKYQATMSSADWWSSKFQISPSDGVLSVASLDGVTGYASSILSSRRDIGPKPLVQTLDLTNRYRFRKPGHYTVTMTTTRASQKQSDAEGQKELTLTSNPVEFEILSPDPEWEAAELNSVLQTLAEEKDPFRRTQAEFRLGLLDTPASVRELLRLYLDSDIGSADSSNLYRSLHESTQLDVLIPLLQDALSNAESAMPFNGAELLAGLQTRRQFGPATPAPDDKAQLQAFREQMIVRQTAFEKYRADANALLVSSLARRSGPRRTDAIFQAWNNAETSLRDQKHPSSTLVQLRRLVLNAAPELSLQKQVWFAGATWDRMPHGELLPLLRGAAQTVALDGPYAFTLYRMWCQGAPDECSDAILTRALEPGSKMSPAVALLMTEKSHPELDATFKRELSKTSMFQFDPESERITALVARVGSPNLRRTVDGVLDIFAGSPAAPCDKEANLLAYLMKVSPVVGAARVLAVLQNGRCGSELLRQLDNVRYSDDLVPVVTKALNLPDFNVAGQAALFLAVHAPASSEQLLWQNLETFWKKHQGGPSLSSQESIFEAEMASALVHARNWKLDPAEVADLKDGCLSDQCRRVAEGKGYTTWSGDN